MSKFDMASRVGGWTTLAAMAWFGLHLPPNGRPNGWYRTHLHLAMHRYFPGSIKVLPFRDKRVFAISDEYGQTEMLHASGTACEYCGHVEEFGEKREWTVEDAARRAYLGYNGPEQSIWTEYKNAM